VDITGRTLSHYRIVEKLGQGASGTVYLAEDLVLGRPVVLKRLPPDADERARERALTEARTIAALNHPNICTLYEYEEVDGEQFLVLEVLEGQTLEGLIAQGALPLPELLDFGIQLADALDAAHTHGIVHRDIKPPNVFVTFRGQIKVLDFGIATLSSPGGASRYTAGATSSRVNALYGTLHYIAPEQLRGEIVDARADLFSLGALLYEMATGHRAFDGADPPDVVAAILGGSVPSVRATFPELPAELDRIIGRALEKHADLRCQSAADLRADLQRLKREVEVAAVTAAVATSPAAAAAAAPAAPAESAAPVGLPWGWLAVAVVVIATGIGVPTLLMRESPPPAAAIEPVPAPPALDPLPPAPAPVVAASPAPVAATPGSVTTVWADPPSDQQPEAAKPARARAPAEPAPAEPALAAAAAAEPAFEPELRAARAAIEGRRFDQAAAGLRELIARAGDTVAGIEAQIQLAHVQARQKKVDDAVAAYAAVCARYPTHPKAAEAMFYQAQTLLRSRRASRDADARKLLTEIADRFRGHAFVSRSLLARGEIEARRGMYEFDKELGKAVPASLITYRTLVALPRVGREREHALWRLAQVYEKVEEFDLAAQTYQTLAESYTSTRYDAWASAARIYDVRLNDAELARAAYQRVPSSSPAFQDAQRYVSRASS
jgi:tRNA A-37 threonylcarbamoyl transferase component Bud32